MEYISKKEGTMLLAFSILNLRNKWEYSNIMLVSSLKGNSGYWEQDSEKKVWICERGKAERMGWGNT